MTSRSDMVQAVTKFIRRFFLFLIRAQPKPEKRRSKRRTLPELGLTQYPTIKALLTDLDSLFSRMKRLQPKNSEAQRMLKKFGTYVVHLHPKGDDDLNNKSLDSAAYGLPTFLSCYENWQAYFKMKETDVAEDFFIATKIHSRSPWIKRKNCVYYDVSQVISNKNGKLRNEARYLVEVNTNGGKVKALRWPQQQQHSFKDCSYTSLNWEYPIIYEHQENQKNQTGIRQALEQSFCSKFNEVMRRELAVNIIVKKNNLRATFTVPHNRWKYFFKERIDVITSSGRKRPIFHAVVAHIRQTKTKATPVRTHYRGSRDFLWGGYNIKIVLQGKHGISQASFDITGFDMDDMDDKKGMVKLTGKYGDLLNNRFEGS
jgi:hypothetical protein